MNETLAILQSPLEPWQKRNRLAARAEGALPAPGLTPEVKALFDRGILCDLFEGNAPYRPRYVLPDYQALLARGSVYLDLAPARDLFEAVGALLAAYRFVPSITGFPVYVGQLDELLEPFWEQEAPATRERLLELLLVQIDRTLPDAFVHLNLGPRDTGVGRAVLAIERRLRKAVPNISLKVAPETPDAFLELAAATALETAKPYFVNHPALTEALGGPYGVASCYNTLPLGGGAHTLVRLNLAALARECPDLRRFRDEALPAALEALASCMEARIRFLVEEAGYFASSFLAQEGLVSLDKFTAMAGIFGLFEAVEVLTGGLRMGRDAQAGDLAEALVLQARNQIKARPVPYCEGTGGRLAFHAQSGIATDVDATPGVRIRPGLEPELPAQLALAARLQGAFDAGASEILLFEPTARRNPAALVRIVRGALAQGLRILAVGASDSELVRITGYLAKRTDLAREGRENLREESVSLAAGALRNGRASERTARSLA